MTHSNGTPKPPRTLLEQKIRERNQTFQEFTEYAEKFARDHKEPGTLSLRHLERLAVGRRGDGRPLGPVRPATARLLERIFGLSIRELLTAPVPAGTVGSDTQLRQRLRVSRRVDSGLLDLLAEQLNGIRQLDRRLGAVVTYREMVAKVAQLTGLLSYSLSPKTRTRLAALLCQAHALAGWAALDLAEINCSWQHHERAKTAAREAGSISLLAHATARQAVVLIDLNEAPAAVEQLAAVRSMTYHAAPVLRAWLAAAHGEGLAEVGCADNAIRAFDEADALLPLYPTDPALPFVFLGGAHLTRWRGHALAVLGHCDATAVLARALRNLDRDHLHARTLHFMLTWLWLL